MVQVIEHKALDSIPKMTKQREKEREKKKKKKKEEEEEEEKEKKEGRKKKERKKEKKKGSKKTKLLNPKIYVNVLFLFIHLFTCAYIVWFIFHPLAPTLSPHPPHF
jgi:hypothetical protein